MSEASLQPIYERLNGANSYHPFSANTFTDWAIEAGDIVTITRESESFTSPVHSSHLSWRGSPQMSLQSRGKKELDSIGKSTQRKFARSGGAYRTAREVGKKSSVFFQKGDPTLQPGVEVSENDVWIDSAMLNSWNDIGELTWDELAEYTWMDFYGCKMYTRSGDTWVEIADEQKENYNFDLLENTVVQLRSIKGDLEGAYSEIKQTKSELYATVKDTKEGLQWELNVTAGLLDSTMRDTKNELQSHITQQADRISLVVEGTGANAHIKPASIVASINAQTGTSRVLISANMVSIDGNTSISDVLSVQNNGSANKGIHVAGKSVFSSSLYVYNHNLDAGNLVDLQYALVSASVDNNVLTIRNAQGEETTFSKATTLSPTWSGSVLTMSAKQTNNDTETTVASKTLGFGNYGSHDIDLVIDTNGYPSRVDATHIRVPLYLGTQNGGSAQPTSRYTKDLNYYIGSLLQEKSVSSNGSVTPDSGYIGLSKVTVSVSTTPTISNSSTDIYTSSSIPSGATNLSRIVSQFNAAAADGDNLIIRVHVGSTVKTFYCSP